MFRDRIHVLTRRCAAAMLGAALLGLPSCTAGSCPETVATASIPDSITSRFATQLQTSVTVSRLGSDEADLLVRFNHQDAIRPAAVGPDRPVTLPLERRDEHWTVLATAIGLDGLTRPVRLKLDTGAQTQLSMSGDTAAEIGVVLPDAFPTSTTHTAFGPKAIEHGVLRELRLGDAILAPIGVDVECTGRRYAPLLGLRTLSRFGHVIFDWPRRRLILLPRGWVTRTQHLADNPGWNTTPWAAAPVSMRRDSIESQGSGRRTISIEMDTPWIRLQLDGRDRVALLDTGFSGGLFAFEPETATATALGTIVGQGFGRRDTFRTRDLADPIGYAGLTWDEVTMIHPRSEFDSLDLVQRSGFEVMVGLELLERAPLWLDFEREEVRIWSGSGPLPEFSEAHTADSQSEGSPFNLTTSNAVSTD